MKTPAFYFVAALSASLLLSCDPDEKVKLSEECVHYATLEDHTGLDGCGYLFKLDNGEYLEAVWRWGWCGTPPLPEGATEDPLYDFEYEDGKRVKIGFEYTDDFASICMKGRQVIITCIEEISIPATEE